MKIHDLYIYPIKSTKGLKLSEINVNKLGFENDRYFGIVNSKNEILTAIENSALLQIHTKISNNSLKINCENESKVVSLHEEYQDIQLSLFNKEVIGKIISPEINKWLTNILKSESKLVKIDLKNLRKTNSSEISFNNLYPIHLTSVESIAALNEKLEIPVQLNHFRPNIIVAGIKAFEEESWTDIIIGECEFKVVSKTERCSLITINPMSGEKEKKQEPLRTLAKEFKSNGKVNFGIYLIPVKTGTIRAADTIKIKTTDSNVYKTIVAH